jgi:DNA-binding NarL/FixJ family response regulator
MEPLMDTIRVMIIDEHPLFRHGVRWALEQSGRCMLIAESADAAQGLQDARAHSPDVVLIDAFLMTGDSLEVARQLRHFSPQVGIIMLTEQEDEEQLFQCIKVGAAAYLLKDVDAEKLIDAIVSVSRGVFLINDNVLSRPHVASRVLRTFREMAAEEEPEAAPLFSPLSSREVEILDYISRGNSNKEIAKSLNISDQTVKNHITSILKKLNVNDRTAAVVHALRHGWIKIHPEES